jgi:endonuclease/exonuclease/phosphatase family metal-dependent hydrolase
MSGRRIRWRTIQRIHDGYVDAFRLKHPDDPGLTLPTSAPHVRLDYVFVPAPHTERLLACRVVTPARAAEASDHFPVAAGILVRCEP